MSDDRKNLMICEVESGGFIGTWNKLNKNREICAGDTIVEIDGVRAHANLLLSTFNAPLLARFIHHLLWALFYRLSNGDSKAWGELSGMIAPHMQSTSI